MAPTLDAALSLPATALGVRAARSAVDAAVRRLSRDDDLLRDVRLCVSEAVTNVVRHA
jgi:anti-sigma regulatory factor (Ser/Thr protein kinase)